MPCSVNEMPHNFHAEEGYGKSSQRASLEELNLMGLHSRRESKEHRRMASSPPGTEMTTFEPREEKAHTQALEMEMQMVSNAAKLKDNLPEPSSSYKTFASFSVSEPEEVDKAILLRSPDTFELGLQQETASVTSVLCEKPPISTQSPAILKTQSKPATKLPPNYKMDENENMPGSNSDSSNARKVKKSKKKQYNVVPSEKIEGYVGNKLLAYILEYIGEKTTNKSSKIVLANDLKNKEPRVGDINVSRRNQRYSEDGKREQQKQSAKVGRKGAGEGGQNKIKRANSLEEVSKSKLEDITIPPYCTSLRGEDRTSKEDEEEYYRSLVKHYDNASVKSEDTQGNLIYSDSNTLSNEDSLGFQIVINRKQRQRKQNVEKHHLPHHLHARGRCKLKLTSEPLSGQSGVDSRDDCNSVHSLPGSQHLPLSMSRLLIGSREALEEQPTLVPSSLPPLKVPNSDAKRPPKMVPASVKAKSMTPLQNQPPVMFVDKTLCSCSVEALTFGFSVNASLIDCAPVLPSPPPRATATPACVEAAARVVSSHLSDRLLDEQSVKSEDSQFHSDSNPLPDEDEFRTVINRKRRIKQKVVNEKHHNSHARAR
ncbi:uncharacterized protein LOC135946330 isoform X2 [Cloeon dipterum]|uniref:uncharacterized protein LOC135946330 isoform X2 n=1 Tax=Cloeon dipterum TaxID=197152 RepID=UPI0032200AB5